MNHYKYEISLIFDYRTSQELGVFNFSTMTSLERSRSFVDERGEMVFDRIPFCIVQSISSFNKKNVLRGMHCSPFDKLVCCRTGSFQDVVVSPDGVVEIFEMQPGGALHIQPHYAHGYFCHEDSEIQYFLGGPGGLDIYYNWQCPRLNIPWAIPLGVVPIVNERDQKAPFFRPVETVVLGSAGFLGSNLLKYVPGSVALNVRLENVAELEKRLTILAPKHVVSAAGISGKPTTAWCETHAAETLYGNVTCQLNLMEVCRKLGIHLTVLGSGGVYEGAGTFSETDAPNAKGSVYR